MAKLPKATIDLTGKTIKQIMDLEVDINKLSRNDLSRVVGRLVSASNKRIRNLAKTEIGRMSPAYQSRMERGGEFSTRGLNTNQLRQLFGETKGFLQLRTSTVTQWKDFREDIEERLGLELNTETKSKRFWKAYRQLEELENIQDKKVRSRMNSDRIQELLAEQYSQKGGFNQKGSDIVSKIRNKMTTLYEEEKREQQQLEEQFDDVGEEDDWVEL